MDLERAAHQLRLDLLAAEVSRTLDGADIPHVLLKGPSTAVWLYDPPRTYRDVDILVPLSAIKTAVAAITESGLADATAGRLSEEAAHSLVMTSAAGYELDLHVTLPMLSPDRDPTPERVWDVLAAHLETMTLAPVGHLPVLDIPGRCLVLALHAVMSGYQNEQVREDLRRARLSATESDWRAAEQLAETLGISALFNAGLTITHQDGPAVGASVEAYLKSIGSPGVTLGIHRLFQVPMRRRAALVFRELFPSVGFMRHAYPETHTRAGMMLARTRRLRRIGRQLPSSYVAWRQAKRLQRPNGSG